MILNKNKPISSINRRKFIGSAGMAAASLTVAPRFAFAGEPVSDRKIRIGIVGGRFGSGFHFHEHPNCVVEAVSDLRPERRERLMEVYKCKKSYESLEKLILDPKIEAVFIATPAPDHVRHVTATLNAGKHVLCAVPAAWTLEECDQLREAVKRSGLTYMMAETSDYYQEVISARKFYKEGRFGEVFRSEAAYHHPGLETLFFEKDTPTWRHGMPPMHYPTHCSSYLISVTGERLTSVSCVGWGDDSPLLKNNPYNNPFWNETAFFTTNKGHGCQLSVCWKGALMDTVRGEWHGSKMSMYGKDPHGLNQILVHTSESLGADDAGFQQHESKIENYDQPQWWNTKMLPEPLRHGGGHDGSHAFITHEFIDSLINDRLPLTNINAALAYTAPGIVAHQSALKGGESMKIPDFDI